MRKVLYTVITILFAVTAFFVGQFAYQYATKQLVTSKTAQTFAQSISKQSQENLVRQIAQTTIEKGVFSINVEGTDSVTCVPASALESIGN